MSLRRGAFWPVPPLRKTLFTDDHATGTTQEPLDTFLYFNEAHRLVGLVQKSRNGGARGSSARDRLDEERQGLVQRFKRV